MSAPVRLAAPPWLCARPWTCALEAAAPGRFALTWSDAEACAEGLVNGEFDLALLPATHYALLCNELRVLPGLAVSVRASLSAAAAHAGALAPLLADADAWGLRTGLPLLSMLWVGRPGAVDEPAATALAHSLALGLLDLEPTVHQHVERHGGDPADLRDLLTSGLGYRLGAQELSGLATLVEEVRANAGMSERGQIRLFDFAYGVEVPAPVPWPRQATGSGSGGSGTRAIDTVLNDAAAGRRLSPDDALRLLEEASLLDLGKAADQRRQSLHPGKIVTYIIDRNVNYTNLCVTACKFCNFYRPVSKKNDGYTLSRAQLAQKLEETVQLGGVQILLQGGVNPNLRLSYYEDLFRWIKASFPLALHALSPEEISFIARLERLSLREVLERLVAAGLDSLPGGGAEVLDDEIRHRISPLKCTTATWLAVMREAHAIGLRTTSTMVFGFGEHPGHVVSHLERLRALQDQTSGFTAFICWPFQAEGTRLKLHDDTTAQRYLRSFALARLYLDNIPNLQVSWPTMGPAIGQIALRFGGNDFGSAMIEENVVSQAGAVFKLSADDIERCVRGAGFEPRRRNMRYQLLSERTAVATRPASPVAA